MSGGNELSLPPHLKSNPGEQNDIHSEKESDGNEKNDKHEHENIISDVKSPEKDNVVHSDADFKNKEHLEDEEKISKDHRFMKNIENTDLLLLIDVLNDEEIREKLKTMSEHELIEKFKKIESLNFYLSKENKVYEFIWTNDKRFQSLSGSDKEVDKDISAPEPFELMYPVKCYFAKKKLEYAEKTLKQKNDHHELELQNLNFELESLKKSLKDLKESKEKFDKIIKIDGRHPVTKKVILQKVAKYFDDSIQTKMDLANRYKIQIQGDIMGQNKILSQITAQKKRLAFLDMTEFQEAQFEYKKSCRDLAMCKEQLGKYKVKLSFLLQKMSKLKKALDKEESDMEQRKNAVIKLQHLKSVVFAEKTRNDEKLSELKASMRKIKLDPRRHDLPEVIDFAEAKRENDILMKSVDKWRKKVEAIQQEKLLYVDALTKRNRY